MAQFPALPLWTDAYLGDTTHLTTIEHGAYLLLLIIAWRDPECRLPNSDKSLARYSRLTIGQWRRIKPVIMEFFTVDGEWIYQGRLTDERAFVRQKSKTQSSNAKARWLKYKDSEDATAMPTACQADAPTPTPTPKKKEYSKLFTEWWMLYPKKSDKQNASSVYEKITKNGTISHEDLLIKTTSYIINCKKTDTFHKGAWRWLKDARYEDEYETKKTGGHKF